MTTAQNHKLSEILGELYQGTLESPPWQSLLGLLRTELNLGAAILYLRKPSKQDLGTLVTEGLELSVEGNIYASEFYMQDPFVNLPPGEVRTLEQYTSMESLRQTDFYLHCLRPYNIHHILGLDLETANGGEACLRLTRPEHSPPFQQSTQDLIKQLAPHLQRAISIYGRMQQIESERALYADAISELSLAALVTDATGQILLANPIARARLKEGDGIVERRGKLRLTRKEEDSLLQTHIGETAAATMLQQAVIPRSMAITRPGKASLGLVVRPGNHLTDYPQGPTVAIFLSDPDRPTRAPRQALTELFGLTAAEAGLAIALANGLSLEQASQRLGISRNTGRAHLRSIFSKTGVSQQTMLVRLVLQSVANLG